MERNPVFVDIDPDTFNIDPKLILSNISIYTKAIVVADIFGQSADIDEIMKIARQFNLKVISDTARHLEQLIKINLQVL